MVLYINNSLEFCFETMFSFFENGKDERILKEKHMREKKLKLSRREQMLDQHATLRTVFLIS